MNTRVIALCLGLALAAGAPAMAGDDWRYVVAPPGKPFANPPPRAIALTDRKPADLEETVRYRGKPRYAHLVYGKGRTAGVAVVVDEIAPDRLDLYVDADRDWKITAKDRVAGAGPTWRVPLKAVIHHGDAVDELPRTVLFRYGRVSRTLAVATCGYVEGGAALDGKTVSVRRVDGDANGLFGDAQDRVWIDHNGDNIWDAAEEEYLFAPILRLGERRIAVRADDRGRRLSFAVLEGTGKLRLVLPRTLKPEQVGEIQVTVQSRDGVAATLRSLNTEVTVPAGEYRLSSLLLMLEDPRGGPSWGYVFTDNGGKDPRWRRLDKGATLTLDPLGALDFSVSVADNQSECRAGDALSVRPALYTGDGLLIERAYRGQFESNPLGSGCGGAIKLASEGGQALDSARSGFA